MREMIQKKIVCLGVLVCHALLREPFLRQQHEVEMIPFGNMDQWIDRQIKESGIIGGATKNVYAIGPTATVTETKAYKNMGGSPWATSNVMARVAGITKTNTSVFPEKRGDGFCARMDTPYGECEGFWNSRYSRCWLPALCFWVRCTNLSREPKIRRKC